MRRIPTVFITDNNKIASKSYNKECMWVMDRTKLNAYIKIDGMPCYSDGAIIYRRYNRKLLKSGKRRDVPKNLIWKPSEIEDSQDKNFYGWLQIDKNSNNKFFIEALTNYVRTHNHSLPMGSYELVGPKINKNIYKLKKHILVRHKNKEILPPPVLWEEIEWFFRFNPIGRSIEGIVFHHRDGRMAKIKRINFGLSWPSVDIK